MTMLAWLIIIAILTAWPLTAATIRAQRWWDEAEERR